MAEATIDEVPLNSTEGTEGSEVEEVEEPQFTSDAVVKKKSTPPAKALGVLTLAVCMVVGAVASYDKIPQRSEGGEANLADAFAMEARVPEMKSPAVKTENAYSVSTTNNFDSEESGGNPDTKQPEAQAHNEISGDVIVSLLGSIEKIAVKVGALEKELKATTKELVNIRTSQEQRDSVLNQKVQSIISAASQLGRDGQSQDEKLNEIISALKGLSVDIVEQRRTFSFKVLHAEKWGDRNRLIGFDGNDASAVVKVYEGNRVGLWTLKAVHLGEKAIFEHQDGVLHEVML